MRYSTLGGLLLLAACSHRETRTAPAVGDAGTREVPLDRLLPAELGQSTLLVYGFPIPRGMQVARRFPNSVHFRGTMPLSVLDAYVKAHVISGVPELSGGRKTYTKTHIRGGDSKRSYDFELSEEHGETQLSIADVTPPPVEPGLSEEERWRRAGYNPDGTPIDPLHAM